MAKSLAFGITINGVGLGEKELAKIEKGAIKSKKAIDDLTSAWKDGGKTMENIAAKQSHIAAAERKLRQDEKTQIRETERVKRDEIKKTTKENKEAARALKSQKKAALEDDAKEKRSIEGLRLIVRDLRKEYNQLSEAQLGSSGGKARLKQLQDEEALLQKRERAYGLASRNVGNYPIGGQIASNLTGGLIGNGKAALIVGGATAAIAAAALLTKEVVSLNSEIDGLQATVRKTTGLNDESVENLTTRLRALDTTTTLKELLEIANVAGKFGITGEKAVGDFTEKVNLLNIALGDNFSGGVEQITTEVSQLSNVLYGTSNNGTILADRMGRLGNALNVLDNSSSATAGQITDIATRIGGLSKTLGFTEGEILGISATIKELGIDVERGSGAFIRLNTAIRSNAGAFAKELGITKDQLLNDLDLKPYETLNDIIAKLVANSGGPSRLIAKLAELKVGGVGTSEIFTKLADGQIRLAQNTDVATEALTNQNSLLAEQQNLTDSLPAQWDRLTNAMSDLFVNSGIQTGLKNITSGLADMVDSLTNGSAEEFFANFAAILTPGTNNADRLAKSLRDKRRSGAAAQAYDPTNPIFGTDGVGRFNAGLLAPVDIAFKSELTEEEKAALAKRQQAIAREKEKAARKAEEELAKGQVGSVKRIEGLISTENENLLRENPKNIEAVNKILDRIRALNVELAKAKGLVETNQLLNNFENRQNFLLSDPESISGFGTAGDVFSQKDGRPKQLDAIDKQNKIIQDRSKEIADENAKILAEQQDQAKEVYINSAIDTTNALLEIWQNYNQKKAQDDIDAINREYEAKFEAVKGNATLELALQREQEEKIAEIEKKAAKEAQRIAIIQANINGALAVVASFKTGVNPYSIAMAIAAGVATAAQIAIIKSQKFASGGFTPNVNGIPDETGHVPVGTVHDGEWVANKKFVSNNRPLFRYLENIQSNTYRPFASGGFASSDIRVPQIFNSVAEAQGVSGFNMEQLEMALERAVERGAYAGTYYGGDDKERKAEQRNIAITNSVR